jgi:DNA-binding response OmpR family regulator
MYRILVIDDDEQIRALLSQMLERAGYQVVEAANGDEGLRLFRTQSADLVITDLIMPEKEGIETILELRREFPQVQVIAISGGGKYNPRDYLPIARQLGACATISKPFSRQEILDAVQAALPPVKGSG